MGLFAFEIAIISNLCKSKGGKRLKAISFGHPDILATPEQLKFLGKELQIDNARVLETRTNLKDKRVVGNARPVFDAMGCDLTVVDVRHGLYNIDCIADLNEDSRSFKLDLSLGGADPYTGYDLVVDAGTSEHCFNVGQAIANMAELVKVGGYIYHMVPLCHWNHGFWNFSPCVFADFYEDNGFSIIRLEAEHRGNIIPVEKVRKFEIPNRGRKLNLICVAQCKEQKAISFPMQRKYR